MYEHDHILYNRSMFLFLLYILYMGVHIEIDPVKKLRCLIQSESMQYVILTLSQSV